MPSNYFRDVSYGLRKLREFLLGRKHTLHGRFSPCIAPRTIPPPDIPRGPDSGYANNYYFKRNSFNSVQPPVVAPVAEGPPLIHDPTKKVETGGIRADAAVAVVILCRVSTKEKLTTIVLTTHAGDKYSQKLSFFGGDPALDSRRYYRVTFSFAPTPGSPWWWDGHCYYDCVPDPPCDYSPPGPPCPCQPCPPA